MTFLLTCFRSKYTFSLITVLVSYLGCFPACYLVNLLLADLDRKWVPSAYLLIGSLILLGLFGIGKLLSRNLGNEVDDWLRNGMFVFCFTCVVDLIIWLDFMGWAKGFMTVYLETCETYLNSSWGAAIGIFDAVGFYSMYHFMIYRQSCGKEWLSVGIYWAGGLLNSMFVEIFGALASNQQITVAILLNLPYFILPMGLLARVYQKTRHSDDIERNSCCSSQSVQIRNHDHGQKEIKVYKVIDACLFLGFLFSSFVILAKGMVGLGSEVSWLTYLTDSEPFIGLTDPAPYGRVQVVVLLLWILPIHCVAMWALIRGSSTLCFFKELVILQAGVVLHAQYNYIYPSLDPLSKEGFLSSWSDPIFWLTNLSVFIIPHLFLLRVLRSKSGRNGDTQAIIVVDRNSSSTIISSRLS